MKYKDPTTGDFKTIKIRATDELPIGSEIDVDDNTEIPVGWEETDDFNSYSTTEKKIGTWIDGKPIYRKVLTFETSVTAGNNIKAYNLNNNINDLKRYISINGFCYFGTYNSFKPIMAGITIDEIANWSIALRDASATTLTFNFGKSLSSTIEGIVILKYTKTTD